MSIWLRNSKESLSWQVVDKEEHLTFEDMSSIINSEGP